MDSAVVGLIGVIVGSIITYIGQYFLFRFEYKKWKKEEKIDFLKYQRENLERKYKECDENLVKAIFESSINIDMGAHFLVSFPENVKDAFNLAMKDHGRDNEKKRSHYMYILTEMKKSLVEFDKQIVKEIEEG